MKRNATAVSVISRLALPLIYTFGRRWMHGSGLHGLFRLIASFLAFLPSPVEEHLNDGLGERAEAE
jgi:hypothetical protein